MASKKISELDVLESVSGSEIIPVAKDGQNYRISVDQIKTSKLENDANFVTNEELTTAIKATEDKIFGEGELAEAFDTIQEIGEYLKDHDDVAEGIYSAIANKQDTIIDLDNIRVDASNGNTAYEWGNHADANYVTSDEIDSLIDENVADYSESEVKGVFSK